MKDLLFYMNNFFQFSYEVTQHMFPFNVCTVVRFLEHMDKTEMNNDVFLIPFAKWKCIIPLFHSSIWIYYPSLGYSNFNIRSTLPTLNRRVLYIVINITIITKRNENKKLLNLWKLSFPIYLLPFHMNIIAELQKINFCDVLIRCE